MSPGMFSIQTLNSNPALAFFAKASATLFQLRLT